MKKSLSLIAIIASFFTLDASAVNGTINFTGEIVKSTCQVSDSDSNKNVVLGKYSTNTFQTVGSVSDLKKFSITLTKCDAGSYSLRFDGITPSGQPNLLAVTGGATGVGVEILDNTSNTPIPISHDNASDAPSVTLAAGDTTPGSAVYNLSAHYKSYATSVTPGQANSSASFSIQYK